MTEDEYAEFLREFFSEVDEDHYDPPTDEELEDMFENDSLGG